MIIGNKYRIFPNESQQKRMKQDIKNCNYSYNWALDWYLLGLIVVKFKNTNFSSKKELEDKIKEEVFFIISKKDKINFLPKDLKCEKNEKYKYLDLTKLFSKQYLGIRLDFLKGLFELNNLNIDDYITKRCEEYKLEISCKKSKKTNESKWYSWSINDLNKKFTSLKKEKLFLLKTPAQALNAEFRNLDTSFKAFFDKKAKKPKFKSKFNTKQSFSIQQNADNKQNRIEGNKLIIPLSSIEKRKGNDKGIKIVLHKPIVGRIGTITISLNAAGNWFVSFPSDDGLTPPIKRTIDEKTTVGIDVGLTSFITKDDGTKIDLPKFFKNNKIEKKKLFYERKIQKIRDRNPNWENSKRYNKIKIKKSVLDEKIKNMRNDFQHKTSHELLDENVSLVATESLRVKNMIKNNKLSRYIANAGFGMIVDKLKYKSEQRGITIHQVDTFFASSKICSCCGHKKDKLSLSIREWICNNCGMKHDRDINAAINIKKEALKSYI